MIKYKLLLIPEGRYLSIEETSGTRTLQTLSHIDAEIAVLNSEAMCLVYYNGNTIWGHKPSVRKPVDTLIAKRALLLRELTKDAIFISKKKACKGLLYFLKSYNKKNYQPCEFDLIIQENTDGEKERR